MESLPSYNSCHRWYNGYIDIRTEHPLYEGDTLYVITGQAINGEWIYVKGKIEDNLFVLISAHPDRYAL